MFIFSPLEKIQTLLKLHPKEKHFLVMNQQKTNFEVFVSFKEVLQRKISWNDLWVNKWFMPSAQLNFLIPRKWELQVCRQLSRSGYMKTGKFMTGSVLKVSLIILHNAYWRWKLSLMISSSSWMGNSSNKSAAPPGNLRRSNGSCLILRHQQLDCHFHGYYPPEKTWCFRDGPAACVLEKK